MLRILGSHHLHFELTRDGGGRREGREKSGHRLKAMKTHVLLQAVTFKWLADPAIFLSFFWYPAFSESQEPDQDRRGQKSQKFCKPGAISMGAQEDYPQLVGDTHK